MKLHYYRETDTLYIDLLDEPSVDSKELDQDIIVDLDEEGRVVGLTIEHASVRTDIHEVEVSELPAVLVKGATPAPDAHELVGA